ncbi:type II secretion system protein [Wolinella succinogenes]|uniref:type II secretion system protein n=1 Tax=Wolinella succinogenes TaxID=844 RepID=UPI002409FECA|nr:hypothetical protein [Wolinella succinogenes]
MRGGFGLIYAIIVMVLIGTLLAFSLRFSSEGSRVSLDEHAQIQLKLYEKSVVEMAILRLQKGDAPPTPPNDPWSWSFPSGYNFQVSTLAINTPQRIYLLDIKGEVTLPLGDDYPLTLTSRRIVKP